MNSHQWEDSVPRRISSQIYKETCSHMDNNSVSYVKTENFSRNCSTKQTFEELKIKLNKALYKVQLDFQERISGNVDDGSADASAYLLWKKENGQQHQTQFPSCAEYSARRKYLDCQREIQVWIIALKHFRTYLRFRRCSSYSGITGFAIHFYK